MWGQSSKLRAWVARDNRSLSSDHLSTGRPKKILLRTDQNNPAVRARRVLQLSKVNLGRYRRWRSKLIEPEPWICWSAFARQHEQLSRRLQSSLFLCGSRTAHSRRLRP